MTRSERIQQVFGKLRGGEIEMVDLQTIKYNGVDIPCLRLFVEAGQLKLQELIKISPKEVVFQARNISWRRARAFLNAHLP